MTKHLEVEKKILIYISLMLIISRKAKVKYFYLRALLTVPELHLKNLEKCNVIRHMLQK